MSRPTGHASPWVWMRDKYRALDRTLTLFRWWEVLFLIAAFTPFLEQLVDYSTVPKPPPEALGNLLGKIMISLPAGLALIFSKRNADTHEDGLKRGALDLSKDWSKSTAGLAAGLSALAATLRATPAKREAPAGHGVYQVMVSIRKTVVAVYDDVHEDDLTITIGVANQSASAMKIVELTPETPERKKGNCYPIPSDPQKHHSMIQARHTRKPNITPDAHVEPELQGKPYRTILSFPILDDEGEVVGVVNIDSKFPNAFTQSTRYVAPESTASALQIVHNLCLPALKSLAILIEQGNLYRVYRNS